jgi:alpha-tubulin suppressor-like RCC1 family protein
LKFTLITAGNVHTCALVSGGAAYCWGSNGGGQIGDGTNFDRPIPTPVSGGLQFRTLSTYGSSTCGYTQIGQLYCWGDNTLGAVGDGTTTTRNVPTLISP